MTAIRLHITTNKPGSRFAAAPLGRVLTRFALAS